MEHILVAADALSEGLLSSLSLFSRDTKNTNIEDTSHALLHRALSGYIGVTADQLHSSPFAYIFWNFIHTHTHTHISPRYINLYVF